MAVLYKLEAFEGPLDLLLHLIDKAEVDINNVPLAAIADQYMEYLTSMQELELDVTSEFLVMAATLLFIKSRSLLPKPLAPELDSGEDESGIDPEQELIQRLIEYRKYKDAADQLRVKELERSLIYTREPQDLSSYAHLIQENPVKGLFPADLFTAFQKALRKAASRLTVARIRRDEISVKDQMKVVLNLLKKKGGKLLFSSLFDYEMSREEIVATFLALLELMKRKQIQCYQDKLFEDIVILAREEEIPVGLQTDEINY